MERALVPIIATVKMVIMEIHAPSSLVLVRTNKSPVTDTVAAFLSILVHVILTGLAESVKFRIAEHQTAAERMANVSPPSSVSVMMVIMASGARNMNASDIRTTTKQSVMDLASVLLLIFVVAMTVIRVAIVPSSNAMELMPLTRQYAEGMEGAPLLIGVIARVATQAASVKSLSASARPKMSHVVRMAFV